MESPVRRGHRTGEQDDDATGGLWPPGTDRRAADGVEEVQAAGVEGELERLSGAGGGPG
jgi:hypothetical protein